LRVQPVAQGGRTNKDAARRKKARVPKAITFKTKPEIALEQIRKAYAAGVPRGAVLIDASYRHVGKVVSIDDNGSGVIARVSEIRPSPPSSPLLLSPKRREGRAGKAAQIGAGLRVHLPQLLLSGAVACEASVLSRSPP
jgi:DDE superfamily endonuclease